MELEILGLAFETLGTLFIAYAALRVHHRILKDHKVDRRVYKIMRREQILGMLGFLFIIIGFFIQVAQIGIVG